MRRPLVSVIGPNASACPPELYDFGVELGQALAQAGYGIVCGGLAGLMEAVCRGAKKVEGSQTIGLLPGEDSQAANNWVDIAIPTGLGVGRNLLVVRSGMAIVAAGGGAGTLSELAFAWQLGKPVLCYTGFEGWAKNLAGIRLDTRREGLLHPVATLEELLEKLRAIHQNESP